MREHGSTSTNHSSFDHIRLVRTIEKNDIQSLDGNDCTLIIALCFIEYISQITDMLCRVQRCI